MEGTGIIGRTEAKIGDFVGREPNPVVLNTVSNIESVQVRFFLTEFEYIFLTRYINPDKIREDRDDRQTGNLTLVLADGSVHEEAGTVDFIDRSIDPRTGSILVQASFPNPMSKVRPGQFARVMLEFEMVSNALLVPQRCITELQGEQSVLKLVNYSRYVTGRENNLFLSWMQTMWLNSGRWKPVSLKMDSG